MTLEKTFLDIKKWVKSIQTAGYNGARTVEEITLILFRIEQLWSSEQRVGEM